MFINQYGQFDDNEVIIEQIFKINIETKDDKGKTMIIELPKNQQNYENKLERSAY